MIYHGLLCVCLEEGRRGEGLSVCLCLRVRKLLECINLHTVCCQISDAIISLLSADMIDCCIVGSLDCG